MADILVIGGNGFLGTQIIDALVADGHTVSAFDRFSAAPVFASEQVRIIPGDFLSRGDIEQAVAGHEIVVHLLSVTTPVSAENDPTLDIRTNVTQTIELLEACVDAGVQHVYYASSGGAIYGDQGKDRYAESDRAMPLSPYAIGKLTIEHYLRYFRARFGLASTVMRISNPYGPGQRPNHKQGLIPIVLRQVASGQPVTRFGDGTMVRDYLYIADMVEMVRRMVRTTPHHDVYNIGSGVGHTVNEVLAAIAEATGSELDIVDRPRPPTFVERVVLDTRRFEEEFGAVDLMPLDEGVRLTWESIRAE